jgi:uncharacterized membrane protein
MDEGLRPDIPRAPEIDGGIISVDPGSIGFTLSTLLGVVGGFFAALWSIYSLIAYIVSIILLMIYVYATIRYNQYSNLITDQVRASERLYDEHYRGVRGQTRLQEVFTHLDSDNPNDWKLAIIEADIILDEILKDRGYAGNSLGERLRSITPTQLGSIDDAWTAHKVRNQIAHGGADFVLTKRLAEETISRYRRVFTEFGIT